MKQFVITLLFVWAIAITACSDGKPKQIAAADQQPAVQSFSAIEGNWILVSNEVLGKQIKPKRFPQQLKMFHDGFFSFVMYDSAGAFYYAGAGRYEVNGNTYKETFDYSSDTTYNDASDWQKWEMKGDTLIFYGYEKAVLSNGHDVTETWGGRDKFVEKRVRAKR